MHPFPPPSISDTRTSFFSSASPNPSDDVVRHVRQSLSAALRLPSSLRWVADWLFDSSESPFHAGLTVPPEVFSTSLAIRISHDVSALAMESEMSFATGLYGRMPMLPQLSRSTSTQDQDAFVLLVPVACLDGVTVGYSFGHGAQPAVIESVMGNLGAHFHGAGSPAFPNFVGRFAFDRNAHDLLVVTNELAHNLVALLSVSKKGEDVRSRRLIAVPKQQYDFYHLPSRPVFMMSNDETRIPSKLRFQFGRDEAREGDVAQNAEMPPSEDRHSHALAGIDDLGPHFAPVGSDLDELMRGSAGVDSEAGLTGNDTNADVLEADEIPAPPPPVPSGSIQDAIPQQQLPAAPLPSLSLDMGQLLSDHDTRNALLGQFGMRLPHAHGHDVDLHALLEPGSQRSQERQGNPDSGSERLQENGTGSVSGDGEGEVPGHGMQGKDMDGLMLHIAHGGPEHGFISEPGNGCYSHMLRGLLGSGEEEEEGPVSNMSTSGSEAASMPPGANHTPWILSNGVSSDGVSLSRRGVQNSSSSGAFDMSTLRQSLEALERSLKGSFYGKRAQRNFMDPMSGEVVARFVGELSATLDGPEPLLTSMLQQKAMNSYYASVLHVDPDTRLLTGMDLCRKRTTRTVLNGTRGAISAGVLGEQDLEARRAKKQKIRREKNRLSAARSNEKRRMQLEARKDELAKLQQRLEILQGRKTVAEEENAALKQSLMLQGQLACFDQSGTLTSS